MEQIEATIHWSTSSFLKDCKRVKRKGNLRWVSDDGLFFYEWDSLHGEIEVFSKKGHHVGVFKPDGSPSVKNMKRGRSIDV